MSEARTDRPVAHDRIAEFGDIHDVRALTATGAIPIVRRRDRTRTTDGRSDDRQ